MGRILHDPAAGTCSLCTSGSGHPDLEPLDYGSLLPLCDVRGCVQPPDGVPVELRLEGEPECWIRVEVCVSCRARLSKRRVPR